MLKHVLGPGALAYPLDVQWRTARILLDRGRIRTPAGLRALIEAVHGDDLAALPDPLVEAEIETIGRQISEAQQALNQSPDARDAY